MTSSEPAPHSGVKFPPPFLFLLGIGVSWFLETRVFRLHLIGGSASTKWLEIIGLALLIAGAALGFWGLLVFARVRTGILPLQPTTRIVSHGPYRFSRNPMYAGMGMAYLGGALIMNSGWMLVTLPIVLLALYRLVIAREEKYLIGAFPVEYGEYRQRVRRWL